MIFYNHNKTFPKCGDLTVDYYLNDIVKEIQSSSYCYTYGINWCEIIWLSLGFFECKSNTFDMLINQSHVESTVYD